jgi:hypothetical protein
MEIADSLNTRASELLEDARKFQSAAAQPGSHVEAADALAALEEALQVLSAAWYQVAADGSPGIVERQRGRAPEARSRPQVDGLPRELEVRLMGTMHDVAAAFARCARVCREGRSEVTSILARRAAAGRDHRSQRNGSPRFQSGERPGQRVA